MTACPHQPVLHIAAAHLVRVGTIETFDAVYHWRCPDCGAPRRTTRLADTMYALRHAYGWDIRTEQMSGDMLAKYVLVKAGDMPAKDQAPHPRRLVRDLEPTSIHQYDGKRIPVEAIPSPQKVECPECGAIRDVGNSQPLLGGYRQLACESKECRDAKGKPKMRFFRPVKSRAVSA